MKRRMLLALLAAWLVPAALLANGGVTRTFDGGDPSYSSNWGKSKNWNPDGLPTKYSDAIIPFSSPYVAVTESNCLARDLEITETGRLVIRGSDNGKYLKIYGDLLNNGTINTAGSPKDNGPVITVYGDIENNGVFDLRGVSRGNAGFILAQKYESGEDCRHTLSGSEPIIFQNLKADRPFTIKGITVYVAGTYTGPAPILEDGGAFVLGEPVSTVLITVNVTDGGEATPSGPTEVPPGSNATFEFNASPGYHVATVTLEGSETPVFESTQPTSDPASYSYTLEGVTSNTTINATFAVNYYPVQAAATGEIGAVALVADTEPLVGEGSQEFYSHGTMITVTATATPGHYFTGWTTVDGELVTPYEGGNPLELTLESHLDVVANFESIPDPMTINISTLEESALREAINAANANPGTDMIVFAPSLSGTVLLSGPLPVLEDAVEIIGATDTEGNPLVTIQPGEGFVGNPDAPDGFQLSGVFLGFGYTPEASTISNLSITGFDGAGVCIGSNNNVIQGCVITGNEGDGVCIVDGSGNLIGGTGAGQGNTIYNNGGNGILVKEASTEDEVDPPARNSFLGNSIYGNTALGIDLANRIGGLGITWNRFPDGSTSQWSDYINQGQNFPDLYFATVSDPASPQPSEISGNLYGAPGTYRIEFFLSDPDASGSGEGRTFVGAADDVVVSGSGDGIASWTAMLTQPLFGGEPLTATATDGAGNSSEFSPNLLAGVITRRFGPIETPSDENNRWVVNTTFSGRALYLPDGKVTLRVGSSFSAGHPGEAFASRIGDAVSAWNTAALDAGVPLEITNGGGDAPDVWGGAPDGSFTLVYNSTDWASTGAPVEALAVTRVRYNALTAAIIDADVAFNAEYFQYQDYPAAPGSGVPDNYADFRAVIVHEFGHAFGGLGDRYNPGDPYFTTLMGLDVTGESDPVTMYGIIRPYDIYQRMVQADDKAGLAFIYGGGGITSTQVDLMLLIDGSTTFADPGSYNGFAASKAAAIELVDKLRVGDYIGVQKLTDATPTIPLTKILSQATRDDLIQQIETSLLPDASDTRPLGSALVSAAGQFTTANTGTRAIIALTAGNETGTPSAISPAVIGTLTGAGAYVFSAGGYAQSTSGQATLSALSDATGGLYFETQDTTVSPVVTQIWSLLAGYQLVGDSTLASDAISWQGNNPLAISWQGKQTAGSGYAISWQGTSSLAISWQGQVDKGTAALLPAISWQGKSGGSVAKVSALAADTPPKFLLALIPPGFDEEVLKTWPANTPDPYGVITPFNLAQYPYGVTYVEGPTYAFYQITGEFKNNPVPTQYLLPGSTWGDLNGVWRLVPIGDNEGIPVPQDPIPVYTSLSTTTDVVLLAELSKSSYARFEPVNISATLFEGGQVQGSHTLGGGPITLADVVAEVKTPGGSTPTVVPLTHAGNGVYRGQFTGTGPGGTYNVKVRAEGTAPLSLEAFTRERNESFYVVPGYLNAVLFAENSITMALASEVKSGDILVNRDGSGSGVELQIGRRVKTQAGFDIKADRISVDRYSTVASDVFYNELSNMGTITGTLTTPLGLPVGSFPPFEEANPGVETADNVVVAYRKNVTLTPGVYGIVYVGLKGTLTLEPGSYSMKALWMAGAGDVEYSGPTRVRIKESLHTHLTSEVIPAPGSGASAEDMIFFVGGDDRERACGCSNAAHLGLSAFMKGTVFAPNGTLYMAAGTDAVGAFFGKDIVVGPSVEVSLASAFGSLTKPSDSGKDQDKTLSDESIPTTFVLSQNYPNPFNPTTEIEYGLPKEATVSLTIFNMLGQEVARLVDEVQPEGYHVVRWDGTNQSGSTVGTGMYVYQLRAGDFVETRKMMLLK